MLPHHLPPHVDALLIYLAFLGLQWFDMPLLSHCPVDALLALWFPIMLGKSPLTPHSLLIPALAPHPTLGSLVLGHAPHPLGLWYPCWAVPPWGTFHTPCVSTSWLWLPLSMNAFSSPLRFWLHMPGWFPSVDAFLIHSDLTSYWPGHLLLWTFSYLAHDLMPLVRSPPLRDIFLTLLRLWHLTLSHRRCGHLPCSAHMIVLGVNCSERAEENLGKGRLLKFF